MMDKGNEAKKGSTANTESAALIERSEESTFGVNDVISDRIFDSALVQMLEKLPICVWLCTPGSNKTEYINKAYEDIWALPVNSMYENSHSFMEPVLPEDLPKLQASVQRHLLNMATKTEYRIQTKTGEIRWIRARSFPIQDDSGKVIKRAGISEDITESMSALEELDRLRSDSTSVAALVGQVNEILESARTAKSIEAFALILGQRIKSQFRIEDISIWYQVSPRHSKKLVHTDKSGKVISSGVCSLLEIDPASNSNSQDSFQNNNQSEEEIAIAFPERLETEIASGKVPIAKIVINNSNSFGKFPIFLPEIMKLLSIAVQPQFAELLSARKQEEFRMAGIPA